MSKIKVCGIKKFEDIIAVNEAKPDYIGFVFVKGRRRISPEQASELVAMLDPSVAVVGLFADEELRAAADTANKCPLDVIQLCGSEDAAYIRRLRGMTHKEIWKSVCAKSAENIEEAGKLGADRLVLDFSSEEERGAVSECLLRGGIEADKLIVRCGTDVRNIAETVERLRPFAVDITSGAEIGGIKDAEKIAALVSAAHGV